MSVYYVSGKLGSGKSLACVGRIRDALLQGRRVATNLDLNLDKLLPASRRNVSVMRLPDKPSVADLDGIGRGTDEVDEERNGLLVLDEMGSWLNAREWSDKSRQGIIDWLIHSRKRGWDVYFIGQSIEMVDKQIRKALVEYLVVCKRLDRMKIPFLGGLIRFATAGYVKGMMPKMHLAIVKYGTSPDSMTADRWMYFSRDLYAAYDTRQVFSPTYSDGLYCYLTPWHLVGRYDNRVRWWRRLKARFAPRPVRVRGKPAPRLERLMQLPPARRWEVARSLVSHHVL